MPVGGATATVLTKTSAADFATAWQAPASGTPADNSITNAMLRDSAGFTVIGKAATGTGDPADIGPAADGNVLRRSGGALGFGQVVAAGIANDAVGNSQLRNGSPCSVIGRSVNSSGDLADINAAADGQVLRRAAGVVAFGALDLADTDAVTGVLPSRTAAPMARPRRRRAPTSTCSARARFRAA